MYARENTNSFVLLSCLYCRITLPSRKLPHMNMNKILIIFLLLIKIANHYLKIIVVINVSSLTILKNKLEYYIQIL